MGMRRKGREITLQVLYAIDFPDKITSIDAYDALNYYLEQLDSICLEADIKSTSSVYEFALNLIKNTLLNLDTIDIMIKEQSENWDFSRLALIDKNILRMATYEIVFQRIHPAIIINEAIEIAKKFSTENSGKFINGILDAVYQKAKDNFNE
ncbi:transcription antitermination factor NusB [bacterium]|nr:transcription antitermination factor NusB [bacterium]